MANGHGGKRNGSGSKPGIPRKPETKKAHEAIHLAFEGIGGVDALIAWAKDNPSSFYERVWPKIIPVQMQHSGDPDGAPIQVTRIELVTPARANGHDTDRATA